MRIELDTQAGPVTWDTDKAKESDGDALHWLVEAATDAVITWPDATPGDNAHAIRNLAETLQMYYGVQIAEHEEAARMMYEVRGAADSLAVQGRWGGHGEPLPAGLSSDAVSWVKANQVAFQALVDLAKRARGLVEA